MAGGGGATSGASSASADSSEKSARSKSFPVRQERGRAEAPAQAGARDHGARLREGERRGGERRGLGHAERRRRRERRRANSDAKQLADGDVYAAASDEIVEGAEGGVEHDAFAEADDDVSPTSPEVATLNPRPDVNEAHAGLL